MATVRIHISYTQIAVFLSNLEKPFNNWTDHHVAQGFSWRPGSVSFRTFEDGDIALTVFVNLDHRESPAAERIIRVPFHVPPGIVVEVGSISESIQLKIPPGDYAITFEHGRAIDGNMWCTLYFDSASSEIQARIIRADTELSQEGDLLMIAEPA